MWKYKSQTLISVMGLAVGFTCFALATLWIVYEMSFDGFYKNAAQMYVIYRPNPNMQSGYGRPTPISLATHLKETFPEVANAVPLSPTSRPTTVTVEDEEQSVFIIQIDSSFFSMFDVKIL